MVCYIFPSSTSKVCQELNYTFFKRQTKIIFTKKSYWRLHIFCFYLSRWICKRHTYTSLSVNPPKSIPTWCRSHRTCFGLAVWISQITSTTWIRVTIMPMHLVYLINQRVPYIYTNCWSFAVIYTKEVRRCHRWIWMAQTIFFQNISYPRQYAIGQVSKNTGICFQNWMPNILQELRRKIIAKSLPKYISISHFLLRYFIHVKRLF
jgi:hypothetical protein